MSGSIGANRIPTAAVRPTVDSYVNEVLKKYPIFKTAKITGSYNIIPKDEKGNVVKGYEKKGGHGDIDLVIIIEGDKKNIKQIKSDFATYLNSLTNDITVPFTAGRHKGKKTAGTGDIIIIQYPINGETDSAVQIDNMIVTSEDELTYRSNFLDIPGPKQAVMMGLSRTMCIEENPYNIFKRLGINNTISLKENQEFEFVLSPKGLSLRVVTLDKFKEIERYDVWNSYNWENVKKLFKDYDIDKDFDELLNQLRNKDWKSERSKRRIKGIFKSMLIIGAGESGTPKGDEKMRTIDLISKLT